MATRKVQLSKRRSLNKTKEINKQEDVRHIRKKKVQSELTKNNERSIIITRKRNAIIKEADKGKNKTVIKKVQKTSDRSRGLRQTLLKESFSNQPISKRLRSQSSDNNNDKKLVEQNLSPKSQKSSVILTKISIQEDIKKPVYMHINASNDSAKNKSDVYDFAFDLNDSAEKLKTKRRRRVMKNAAQNTKKKRLPQVKIPISKKTNAAKTEINKKNAQKSKVSKQVAKWKTFDVKSAKISALRNTKKVKKPTKTQNIQTIDEQPAPAIENMEQCPNNFPENIIDSTGNTEKDVIPKITESEKKEKAKPTIRSVENLHDAKVTIINPIESNTKNLSSQLINTSNINVNNRIIQYRAMKNHSLLDKSLSPITKAFNNFDIGSPWRVPTFSHVRNLFQSTPAVKINNENVQQINVKNTGQTTLNTSSAQKGRLSSSLRKFGTEITNIDHSTPPSINATAVDRNDRAPVDQILSPNDQPQTNLNISKFNDVDDKENTVPNYQTPKKSTTRKLRNIKRTLSLKKVTTIQSQKREQKKENLKVKSQKEIDSMLKKPMELVTEQKLIESSNLQTDVVPEQENISQSSSDVQFENVEPQTEESSLQRSTTFEERKEINEKENLESQPGPSGLQSTKQKGILQERNYQEIENFEPQPGPSGLQNSPVFNSKGILREKNDQTENFEPQPGPSGLQKSPAPKLKGILKRENYEQKENLEPQPGPSGLQKENILKSEKIIMRQTNLSSFLNLPEIPESSVIKTSHGIFDDAHSTPINGKPIKKIQKAEPALENAFGFAESSDSELDISPINPEEKPKVEKQIKIRKSERKIPARLSVGEIKTKLLPKKIKPIEIKKTEVKENIEEPVEDLNKQAKKLLVDAANFSDTFDVFSETEETSKDVDAEIPLFVDLEPVHFKEPPRHSYKRKRAVNYSFSDDSVDEEIDKLEEKKKKRKKIGRLNKKEEDRLMEWVKNVNQTFTEIDQHDLVIE